MEAPLPPASTTAPAAPTAVQAPAQHQCSRCHRPATRELWWATTSIPRGRQVKLCAGPYCIRYATQTALREATAEIVSVEPL
jgi:hypothetical protein